MGQSQPGPLVRLTQHSAIERGVVGDQHPILQPLLEQRHDRVERRGAVDHRLGDPGEALDPPPQRHVRAHQRCPPLMQLTTADQHRTDLGQLASVAGKTVGLGVDDEELGAGDRLLQHLHYPA